VIPQDVHNQNIESLLESLVLVLGTP